MNKIAVCAIAKNENRYIREWIEHYKSLNVDKIFLYDNNDANGERFKEVIADYIDSGFVNVIDYRGRTCCQMISYVECYKNFSKDYEWIAFFDADEFLELNDFSDIHDYLDQECFSDCNLIHINWMIFDDNDLVHYEDKPLKIRFTRPANFDLKRAYDFPENNHVKSIIRRGFDMPLFGNPHTILNNDAVCKDNKGDTCIASTPFLNYDHSCAYLAHYQMKTIEEFFEKRRRGYPDQPFEYAIRHFTAEDFFKMNKDTFEKRVTWNKLIKDELLRSANIRMA